MSYANRKIEELGLSRLVLADIPDWKDVVVPRVEEELIDFATHAVLQPPFRQIRWISAPKGHESEILHKLIKKLWVVDRMFNLDDPSNLSNVHESIYQALVIDESIAVTPSNETLDALTFLVDDDNAHRQYIIDRVNHDIRRRMNLLYPPFCYPTFEILVLRPDKFKQSQSQLNSGNSNLTIYDDNGHPHQYVVASDGELRESPGGPDQPLLPPFSAPGERPVIYSVNPFLVTLNAHQKFCRYNEEGNSTPLSPHAQMLFDKVMKLVESLHWEAVVPEKEADNKDEDEDQDEDEGESEDESEGSSEDDSEDEGELKGEDEKGKEDEDKELQELSDYMKHAPPGRERVEASMRYGEILMGGSSTARNSRDKAMRKQFQPTK